MNADHFLTRPNWRGATLEDILPPLVVDVEPAPRPWFSGPFPYHQPPCGFDAKQFLDRTEGQSGHTFTENGRQ